MVDVDGDGCSGATLLMQLTRSMEEATKAEIESAIVSRTRLIQATLDPRTFPEKPEAALVRSESAYSKFCGFNEQLVRSSILLHLIKSLSIDVFIETGAFRGETCLLVAAQTPARVLSCELVLGHLMFAQMLLAPFGERIQITHEDSRRFLERIFADENENIRLPFLYLDAHWYKDLPLLGELERIFSSRQEYVIVIDDFRVPSDEGFGFDSYSHIALEWDFIAPTILKQGQPPSVWYPAYPAHLETGAKRGFIMLASGNLTENISTLIPSSLLRRAVV
jgi:predicted O-methyltransferase YrrM